jgi:hypothetical protein
MNNFFYSSLKYCKTPENLSKDKVLEYLKQLIDYDFNLIIDIIDYKYLIVIDNCYQNDEDIQYYLKTIKEKISLQYIKLHNIINKQILIKI